MLFGKSVRKTSRNRQHQPNLEQLEPKRLLAADVYISEFVASNDTGLADEDGDFPDWLEIYNAGPDNINLGDWHLTDDADELRKWSFPDQDLAAGNFQIVYLSDKDRAEAGSPLHANFKIASGGEYLALVEDTGTGTLEVRSEYAPEFPRQTTDVSYGFEQTVETRQFSTADDAARYFIPLDDTLGTDWTAFDFDDSGWMESTASFGYQQTVPGFTVVDAKSNGRIVNLSEANAVLDGSGQESRTTGVYPVINFLDIEGGGGVGNIDGDVDFPNDSPDDDNDFAIRATGLVTIPSGGQWTFAINSDDGAQLRLDGTRLITDDTLHAPQTTLRNRILRAGQASLELTFFERGGGAEVELWAAQGDHDEFNDQFRLIGDVANGGLRVDTSPSGSSNVFGDLYETDLSEELYNTSTSLYGRIPVNIEDPSALDSLTLQMNYDDGFVAYINGQEVARRNAPDGVPTFNTTSTDDRSRFDAELTESVDVSPFINLLQPGENILAIHGLNDDAGSPEFLLRAEMQEVSVEQGELRYFPEPTPRTFNTTTGVDGFLFDDVQLSQPHGFFDEAFELTMNARTEGTTIRYTTDGSEPTAKNGMEYDEAITVDETTTVRARAFKDGFEPSLSTTATYIFLADVVEQSGQPEGWPSVNGQVMDYGMDPNIVNDPEWGPQMVEALTQVPSMSIVMDVDDFIGQRRGIYNHAGSHGKAWERPASLELINPDGSEGFQVNAGVRIRGGFSRTSSNPKHAFRLFFRDEYGDAKLEYPLFGDEGVDSFDKIDLRTTQNYSWAFQSDRDNTFIRDVLSRDIQRDLGDPYTRSRYYHLYINGEYWGLFQSQERAEARYAESYFGGDKDDYDVVKSAGGSGGYRNEATDGTLDAYRRLSNFFYQGGGLSDRNMDDYWRAQGMNPDGTRNLDYERLLDVDNLINYMTIVYFTGDRDGPVSYFVTGVNNYFGIYNRREPDGFKFFEHDSEHTLDKGFDDLVVRGTGTGASFDLFNPMWMHQQLIEGNTEYRLRFADTVQRLLHNDGVLTEDNLNAMVDARAAEFDMAIIAESARWGDSRRGGFAYTKDDWERAVDNVKLYFSGREAELIRQMRSRDWYPDGNAPEFRVDGADMHGGQIESNDELSLFVPSSTVISITDTLVAAGSEWNYLDDGSNQGTAWRATDFDDGTWDSGDAPLGYGDGDEATVVGFGPNSSNKFVTTYYRHSFEVSDPQFDILRVRLQRDDGAVVYLNGEEVVRSNMPAGEITSTTTAAIVVGGSQEDTYFEFDISSSLLRAGENVISVEVHQENRGSSDTSFDLELLAGRVSLVEGAELYYTTDGSDPRLIGGELNPNAVPYTGGFRLPASATIKARTLEEGEWGLLGEAAFEVESISVPGDLNNDAIVDASDIDILAAAIAASSSDTEFDLDSSGDVDGSDLTYLVESILGTREGDIDLDGDVDFSDFLGLSGNFGKASAGWADGNFDLDAETAFPDFLALSSNFGFGTIAAAADISSLLFGEDDESEDESTL